MLGIEPGPARRGELDTFSSEVSGARVARVRDRFDPVRPADAAHDSAAAPDGGPAARAATVPETGVIDRWFLSAEKIVWRWPYIEDAVVLEDPEQQTATGNGVQRQPR